MKHLIIAITFIVLSISMFALYLAFMYNLMFSLAGF